ncbi:MAG TPA: hypothetical protein VJ963_01015 [Bacteroidales bacterium]|nr:hypothetical protein [Bacteroidales bacterium]
MAKLIRIITLLILVLLFSCEKQGLFVNCSECTGEEPTNTDIQIKVSVSEANPAVPVRVYEGFLGDSILYSTLTAHLKNNYINLTINKQYTFTATYYIGGKKYITVDSATPQVKYEKDQCDNPCYFVYDKEVNLKLKYTK